MPRLFISGILFFLLLGAGYGLISAAQPTPWDCSDWQAFAHDDRTTAILESLAANRGKTLYCGVDQSDTFTKAETWEAGKDRNERDDTVYFGERGSFRGFIAAQEGWLTEGESGITGQSIATIFEFPKEPRRGKRTVRRKIPADPSRTIRSLAGPTLSGLNVNTRAIAETAARNQFIATPPAATAWDELAQPVAQAYCRARGYRRASNAATIPFTHTAGDTRGWAYTEDLDARANYYTFAAYQTREWTATCVKKERRR